MSSTSTTSLSGILDHLKEAAETEHITIGTVLSAIGYRAIGPLLFVSALILISPIGAIPGVPLLMAALIIILSMQMIWGTQSLWLPTVITKRPIPPDKLHEALDKLSPYASGIDRFVGDRMNWAIQDPMPRIIALICVVLALLVIPAGLIPFAAALPGGAIMLLSLGLATRDGLIVLLGFIGSAAASTATILLL
ncbi:exopolysaccharide biosynthesis protein [Pseudovibrio exalbescens]|uniref:Exopolysaccharide synthesis, ExoD n=1 Tax=Pseudovibrio exalbescens TaxID=197461 RepID=A0A1U7JK80_9HYPH|nr:exopolysaccharide biosynthesis protein [Pseudovibrio exalbescens]OKL45129.1 hypothetical protein A3843_05085 [Pseudovibrio exalbescens]